MPAKVQQNPDAVVITLGNNARTSCFVNLWGATLTSWKVDGTELLFLSKKAVNDGAAGKAIRGGIPLVFPQFGPMGMLVQHGFARISKWVWDGVQSETPDRVIAQFSLQHDNASIPKGQLDLWQHKFKVLFVVELSDLSLKTKFVVKNLEENKDWPFTALFHTYLKTDINKTELKPFNNTQYKLPNGPNILKEVHETLTFNGSEFDRTYVRPLPGTVALKTGLWPHAQIHVERGGGMEDIVVWNPGHEKAKAISDLHAGGENEFVCVEVGAVGEMVFLRRGEEWSGWQTLSVGHNRE